MVFEPDDDTMPSRMKVAKRVTKTHFQLNNIAAAHQKAKREPLEKFIALQMEIPGVSPLFSYDETFFRYLFGEDFYA